MFNVVQFLKEIPDSSILYVAHYDAKWIVISILTVILTSYAALIASDRANASTEKPSRLIWVLISAIAFGAGTWAMHFIGMLALRLPCGITYNPIITLISVIPSLLAGGLVFGFVWNDKINKLSTAIGSILLGAGIGTMHYTGMAAMHIDGAVRYDPELFTLSVIVAILLSYFALNTKNSNLSSKPYSKALIATILGGAVSGMHYIAMAASYFVKGDTGALPTTFFTPDSLAIIVALAAACLAFIAIVFATLSHKTEVLSVLKQSEEVLRVLAESQSTTEDIFRVMVRQLAMTLGTRYALIGQATMPDASRIETLAVWANGHFVDNFTYDLKGTPCAVALGNKQCFHPKGVQQQFPEDFLLVEMHAESYMGVTLNDSKGKLLGIIALIDDKPMTDEPRILQLLNSLARRAGLELERMDVHRQLKLSHSILHHTLEGVIITNAQNEIIDVNPAFSSITGYSLEDVLGQNPHINSSGRQNPEFYQAMWESINELGHWQGELWNRTKDGKLYAELLSTSVLKNEQGEVTNYISIFTDITHIKEQQEQLSLMAQYDMLTGLPNRSLFTDRFTQAIARSKRTGHQLAVCFLDLDDFKPINDRYGHEVGDQLLVEVAKRISMNIREDDTACRQGGDEFVLLLNDMESYGQCEVSLERILHALAQPYVIDDISHRITVSIGATLYPDDDADVDTLIRHADNAMYQAKQSGKHRYHIFDSQHDKQLAQKHHKLDEIRRALIDGEFQLYYQPKVNMVTGEVFGAEALIRWFHPKKGMIPPLDFLPIVDGTDLDTQIGNWVINQAVQQMDSWLSQGIKLEISVNISSRHLQSDGFFANLEQVLMQYPTVDASNLQLEILESSVLSDLQAVSQIIKTCQEALGVNVALDDFGTGYSSLTHLRSLTASVIKIDQSFVRDILDDPSDYTIIDGVIGLADSFGREVIAEGVETTAHGLMLQILGCKQAQGYGIARPMPANSIPEWLSHYQPNQQWLECGTEVCTNKENKLKLLRLINHHCMSLFVYNIQSAPEDIKRWPIMDGKHCHFGAWIKRAKKERLFTSEHLDGLKLTHEHFLSVAQAIHYQHQEGDIDAARKALSQLQSAFDALNHAVRACE